ncbi:DUF2628 domain-containing protein [Lachnospiraceae bacterium NSJ-143]|nr:DUF2628 domain-containing protein [Lachnospiraceae bacterium NSJ-143]
MKNCVKCGNKLNDLDLYCGRCGTKQDSTATLQPGSEESEISYKGVPLYSLAEKNSLYYKEAFKCIIDGKVKINWSALVLFPYWSIYRKMYIYAAVYYIAVISLGILSRITKFPIVFISMALNIAVGFYGNQIYKLHLQRLIDRAVMFPSVQERSRFLSKKSGVSTVALVVFVVANIIILIAVISFFIFMLVVTFGIFNKIISLD